MKKSLFFAAVCCLFAVVCCTEKEPQVKPLDPPPVTIDELISGPVKAGFAGAVTIKGEEFFEDDFVCATYIDETGEELTETLSSSVLEIRKARITFGIPVTAGYAGKEVVFYLDRAGYSLLPITGKITVTLPEVSEGYIPDPGFRETLMSDHPQEGNPNIAPLFDSYGMLNVEGAAKYTGGINLYNSTAKNLKGIELFKSVCTGEAITGWENSCIEEVDLSNFTGEGSVHFQNCPNLRKFIGGPYHYLVNLYNCPKLEEVDMSHTVWCWNLQLRGSSNTKDGFSTVKNLDIRKKIHQDYSFYCYPEGSDSYVVQGTYPSAFDDPHLMTTAYRNDCAIRVGGDCKIKVTQKFVKDARATDWEKSSFYGGYAGIWYAWTLGATVDVYDDFDIEKHLGTVVPYAENNNALPKLANGEITYKN